jgi:acetyltransferase-like isoleucine patch superfamily enzyme
MMQPHRTPQQTPHPLGGPKEKEKMLNGELYMPYTNELTADRESCKVRVAKYNDGHLYTTKKDDRLALLNLILEPQDQTIRVPGAPPTSRVGKNTYVDAPFKCDYGYNIVIGQDVAIESGCFISDPREVYIGNFSMIGPDVKIMGKQYPYNPSERKGSLVGKARGFKIIIGEGVCIGAGCIISPREENCKNGELVIGNGAYIPDGTIVTKVSSIAMSWPMTNSHNRTSPSIAFSISNLPIMLKFRKCFQFMMTNDKISGEGVGTWLLIKPCVHFHIIPLSCVLRRPVQLHPLSSTPPFSTDVTKNHENSRCYHWSFVIFLQQAWFSQLLSNELLFNSRKKIWREPVVLNNFISPLLLFQS